MAYCLVYMTAETPEEAKGLGRALVEARLAACANVIPGMVPIFWWDGKVQEGSEAVLIAKTLSFTASSGVTIDIRKSNCRSALPGPYNRGIVLLQ